MRLYNFSSLLRLMLPGDPMFVAVEGLLQWRLRQDSLQ